MVEKYYRIYKNEVEIIDAVRVGRIKNGGKILSRNSEYDYIFYKVYEYKNKNLSIDELMTICNIARKLVEAFLSFKFPKQRGNLKQLLEKALPLEEKRIQRERIYSFLNCYSHADRIHVLEDSSEDILIAESSSIINEVLEMIKNVDRDHYDAMVALVRDDLSN